MNGDDPSQQPARGKMHGGDRPQVGASASSSQPPRIPQMNPHTYLFDKGNVNIVNQTISNSTIKFVTYFGCNVNMGYQNKMDIPGDMNKETQKTSQGKVLGIEVDEEVMKKKFPRIGAKRQRDHDDTVPYDVGAPITELNGELSQYVKQLQRKVEQQEQQFRQQRQILERMQYELQQQVQQVQAQYQQYGPPPFMASPSSWGRGAFVHPKQLPTQEKPASRYEDPFARYPGELLRRTDENGDGDRDKDKIKNKDNKDNKE